MREFAAYLGIRPAWSASGRSGQVPRPVNYEALDTALARASHEARARFAGWPTHTATAGASLVNGSHWAVHLPLRAPNLAAALPLAEAVGLAVEHLPRLVTADIAAFTNGRQPGASAVVMPKIDVPGAGGGVALGVAP